MDSSLICSFESEYDKVKQIEVDCLSSYDNCESKKNCCPKGTMYVGETGCTTGIKKSFLCVAKDPPMSIQQKYNCCANKNIPTTGAIGYCARGWCTDSSNCIDFSKNYCSEHMFDSYCQQFCKTGHCSLFQPLDNVLSRLQVNSILMKVFGAGIAMNLIIILIFVIVKLK